MPKFYEISFEPVVQQWIITVEELIGHSLTAQDQLKLSYIFAEIHQDGYRAGSRDGASRITNAQRGQDMGA